MAHFLKGKYRGFYKAGTSECVRDIFRFNKVSENKVKVEITRRDLESFAGRFWRWEWSTINLMPVDETQPRLGGKVHVSGLYVDFRTLTAGS